MPDEVLFPGFFEDPAVYDAAVAYWRATCDRLLAQAHPEGWEFIGTGRFVDGTFNRDGNPMFEIVNERLARIVRLLQFEADPGERIVSAYLDTRREDDSVDELVICCTLTTRSAAMIADLITCWIDPGTTKLAMSDRLRSI